MLDKWLVSKNVNGNYDRLRELFLLEEFKQCVPIDIRTHIDHKGANTLDEAAKMADNYALTSKQSFIRKGQVGNHLLGQNNSSSYPTNIKADKHGKPEGTILKDKFPQRGIENKSEPTCSYRKKKGHIISECFKL